MKFNYLTYLTLTLLIISSQTLAQTINSGEVIGRHIYGLATDYQGDPVLINDKPLIYEASNFDETITIEDASYLVSGFSNSIGGIYITHLEKKTYKMSDTVSLNLASIDGLSYPTAGIKTGWNSIMLAESRLINAEDPDEFINTFKPFYKGKTKLVNPYKYGWISEVIVLDSQGQTKAIKNYAMGRVFANQVVLMPDGKTLYMLDSLGHLYLFVTEQANSMAKGKLYAVSRELGQIKYHLLGKSSALKVKFKLKKIKFKSIFKKSVPVDQACNKKFTYVKTVYGEECLQLKSKNKKYAAFFEPIRLRAFKGISGFSANNSRMIFDAENRRFRFTHPAQSAVVLAVGDDPQFNSQFIIKEP